MRQSFNGLIRAWRIFPPGPAACAAAAAAAEDLERRIQTYVYILYMPGFPHSDVSLHYTYEHKKETLLFES
jgi:hypothetical protein